MRGGCSSKMNPRERYLKAFGELYAVCKEQGWGDPFSYARSREIHMALALGHTVARTYSGPDGHEIDGTAVEYKSTICSSITGTYNGISVHNTWEEQVEYLKNKKLACYTHHYFARYKDEAIVEMWRLPGEKVFELLLPKLHKQFHTESKRKDPRLGATLTAKEIKTFGEELSID